MKCDMQVLIAKCPDSVQIPDDGVVSSDDRDKAAASRYSGQGIILRLMQAHPESLTGGTGSHQDEERELKGFAAYLTYKCF